MIVLIIFLGALLISAVFVFALGRKGPWGSFWLFVLFLFLFGYAVSLWTVPVGPVFYGLYIIPILITLLLIGFLLAAITPTSHRIRSYGMNATPTDVKEAKKTEFTYDIFFWAMLVVLLSVILVSFI